MCGAFPNFPERDKGQATRIRMRGRSCRRQLANRYYNYREEKLKANREASEQVYPLTAKMSEVGNN